MSLLGRDDLKEQQKIKELEKKIQDERDKLDKKVIHQKIVLGEFLLDMLEKNAVVGLKEYTVNNLDEFLTRKTDKESFKAFIDSLKDEPKDEEEIDKDEDEENKSYSTSSSDNNNNVGFNAI